MLLNLLWRDRCHPLTVLPAELDAYLAPFGFPIVALRCDEAGQAPRISFADEALMPGLSVADALCEELDILTTDDAVVVLLPRGGGSACQRGSRLAAEILHAVIRRSADYPHQIEGLFDWAFRSLAESWATYAPSEAAHQQARDSALHAVLDYPAHRAEFGLAAYLELLDPGHRSHAPDPELALRLARNLTVADWHQSLVDVFEQVRCRGVVT